ncbi:MAG: PCRF domain-containing protein [Clostridia bacterium]|nr:PCRF domain-containing protein [Clostridia bacterium]
MAELEQEALKQEFWKDAKKSKKTMKEIKRLKEKKERYTNLIEAWENNKILYELVSEENDQRFIKEIRENFCHIQKVYEKLKVEALFKDENDKRNAILILNSKGKGLEARQWVQELLQMYIKWSEHKGFMIQMNFDVIDSTLLIIGTYAYGNLKGEKGIHCKMMKSENRLEGIHDCLAYVDVIPEMDDEIEFQIAPEDIVINHYCTRDENGVPASSARMVHIPTGIEVAYNNPLLFKNRELAIKILKSKLFEHKQYSGLKEIPLGIDWESQIRSYILDPSPLVIDNRTDYRESGVKDILNGKIDGFIYAWLEMQGKDKR